MGNRSSEEGWQAYGSGKPRAANPHDPGDENWMGWRDGWEQAKAAAARLAEAVVGPSTGIRT